MSIKELMNLSIEEREIEIYKLLKKVDCGEHIEKLKQGGTELSYLSWAWAVDTLKDILPMNYEIKYFDNEKGIKVPYVYDELTGYMVQNQNTLAQMEDMKFRPTQLSGAQTAATDYSLGAKRFYADFLSIKAEYPLL